MRVVFGLVCLCLVLVWAAAMAENANHAMMEEQGIESGDLLQSGDSGEPGERFIALDSLPARDVLLIPCSSAGQRGVNVFDPFDGTYLGNFVADEALFSTPINAIQGTDDNIYVSDQVRDAVFVFNRQGNFLYNYADASDGLDNVRGIDFRDGHLFISISPTTGKAIAEFDGPHSRLADFINDGSDPFDIYFLEDGRALMADIYGSTDNVRLYNADGTLSGQIFSVDFPEQIQADDVGNCPYLNASFSDNIISDFNLAGVIEQTTPWSGGRGVYRLGNGNLLATNGSGVYEIEPGTGAVIEQQATGSGRFIELVHGPQGGGSSEIEISPLAFADTLEEGSFVRHNLYISNTGTITLFYGLHDTQAWIIAFSDTGNVPAAATDTVEIEFNSAGLTPGEYAGLINVNSSDTDEAVTEIPVALVVTGGPSGCQYIPGDINGNGSANGIDVTYGVSYLKGGTPPPDTCFNCPDQGDTLLAAMDVNGNCSANGIDITFFVAYLKGLQPSLLYCQDCPPATGLAPPAPVVMPIISPILKSRGVLRPGE